MGAVLVGSVIDQRYLAEARVMAHSVLAREPGARVFVVIADGAATARAEEPFTPVSPADIGVDDRELARRAAIYTPQELVSSLKPLLVRHLVRRHGTPAVLLDADCLVLGGLSALTRPAERHAVVLTPHRCAPAVHRPGAYGPEQDFLRSGVYNGGVLACGPGAGPFLDWWAPRTARDNIVDTGQALMMSQNWLSLVPALFDHHVVRDRGINVMGHNLGDDDLEWPAAGPPTVAGTPVRLHHFAGGFDAHRPLALYDGPARYPWWPDATRRPGLARLCERRRAAARRRIRRAARPPHPVRRGRHRPAGHTDAPGRPRGDRHRRGHGNPRLAGPAGRRGRRRRLAGGAVCAGLTALALADDAARAAPGPAGRVPRGRERRGSLAQWAASKGPPGPHGLPLAARDASGYTTAVNGISRMAAARTDGNVPA